MVVAALEKNMLQAALDKKLCLDLRQIKAMLGAEPAENCWVLR